MINYYKPILILFCLWLTHTANGQIVFTSLDQLLQYTTAQSRVLKSDEIKLDQAKKEKLAAVLGIIDPSGSASLNYTDNTRLQVLLLPGEIFGGQPGTFQQVRAGLQYVTNASLYAEIKLINLQGWANLHLSKSNIEVVNSNKKLNLKNFYEDIASIYYNIANLSAQRIAAGNNVAAADTLLKIANRKYALGLIKQQDVNDAEVNYLTTTESEKQIRFSIHKQYLALKILCDIPERDSIEINNPVELNVITQGKRQADINNLKAYNDRFKEVSALQSYRQAKYALYPSLVMNGSYNNQQYNKNAYVFDKRVDWITSSYIGLKLSLSIPSASTISQINKARYDYLLAKNNTEHTVLESTLQASQLTNDYDKAMSQFNNYKIVYALRNETYNKNFLNYSEGIISISQTLDSFNDMVNSNYNLISSAISVLQAESKIDINNKIR